MNKWFNYGDINPLEHGGLWIRKDTFYPTCYDFVKVDIDCDQNYMYCSGYIDISDTWINWNAINDVCGASEDDFWKVVNAIYYYGVGEFQAHYTITNSRREVRKFVNSYGIVIHRK